MATYRARIADSGEIVIHIVREGEPKTLCRALPDDAGAVRPIGRHKICPACLDVLKVDWLLEDATARK